jgi:hypothetical protein
MIKFIHLTFTTGILATVVACQPVKDMHDATMDMKDQTRALGQTSSEIADTSKGLKSAQQDLQGNIRQGGGFPIRQTSIDDILKASRAEPQLDDAGAYLWAFEYQQWSGFGTDDLQARDELAREAVMDFYSGVHKCIPADHDMKTPEPLAEGAAASKARCLNAIAVSLQEVNIHQVEGVRRWNANHPSQKPIQPLSMLSMIEDALLARKDIAAGVKLATDYPIYTQELLKFTDDTSILLMQTRYNFFGTMVLSELSRLAAGFIQGRKVFFGALLPQSWTRTHDWGFGWNIDLSQPSLDDSVLGRFTGYLHDGLEARALLVTIGVTPIMNKALWYIYHRRTVTPSPENAAITPEKRAAESDFIAEMRAYEKSAGPFGWAESTGYGLGSDLEWLQESTFELFFQAR